MKVRLSGFLPLLVLVMNAGCDDSNNRPPPTSPVPTPTASPSPTAAQSIATLEASGALPKLDRAEGVNGLDANGNGVRDDLDAYVSGLNASPDQKASLLQQAKAVQQALNASPTNRAAIDAAQLAEARAIHCVYARFPVADATSAATISKRIEELSLNTRARISAYIAYGEASDGTVLPSPEGDTCD